MNGSEIYERVTRLADRFGSRNPQQVSFLFSILAKCEQQQLAKTLIDIFTQENSCERQELSGALLIELKPRYVADLRTVIQSVLVHWDISVEQLRYYLAFIYGADSFKKCLADILEDDLDDNKRKKLQTMLWWMRNYPN